MWIRHDEKGGSPIKWRIKRNFDFLGGHKSFWGALAFCELIWLSLSLKCRMRHQSERRWIIDAFVTDRSRPPREQIINKICDRRRARDSCIHNKHTITHSTYFSKPPYRLYTCFVLHRHTKVEISKHKRFGNYFVLQTNCFGINMEFFSVKVSRVLGISVYLILGYCPTKYYSVIKEQFQSFLFGLF
jgi:hypothetical protein